MLFSIKYLQAPVINDGLLISIFLQKLLIISKSSVFNATFSCFFVLSCFFLALYFLSARFCASVLLNKIKLQFSKITHINLYIGRYLYVVFVKFLVDIITIV